jgi:hypothetical protein
MSDSFYRQDRMEETRNYSSKEPVLQFRVVESGVGRTACAQVVRWSPAAREVIRDTPSAYGLSSPVCLCPRASSFS